MTISDDVQQVAEDHLSGAPRSWIEQLAKRLQQEILDTQVEYDDWCQERASLRGYDETEIAEKF